MASSDDVFEMVRMQTRRLLARALYESTTRGSVPFRHLPEKAQNAFLEQADYVLDRFNVTAKSS